MAVRSTSPAPPFPSIAIRRDTPATASISASTPTAKRPWRASLRCLLRGWRHWNASNSFACSTTVSTSTSRPRPPTPSASILKRISGQPRPSSPRALEAENLASSAPNASGLLRSRHVHVHRLNSNPARPGKPVPYQTSRAGKQSRRQLLELRFHLHRSVLVNPSTRLDVNLLSGAKRNFKDIPVPVHPHNSIALHRPEMIDKEPRASQQHVRHALHARKRVVHAACGRKELMLAHVEPLAAVQMHGEDMPRAIAAEPDLPWTAGLCQKDGHSRQHALQRALQRPDANPISVQMHGEDMPRAIAAEPDLPWTAGLCQKDGHSRQHALQRALQRPDANPISVQMHGEDMPRAIAAEPDLPWTAGLCQKDGHSRQHALQRALQRPDANPNIEILPEKDVMLEINRHPAELKVQNGHEFAFDVVRDSGKILRKGCGGSQHRDGHSQLQIDRNGVRPIIVGRPRSRKLSLRRQLRASGFAPERRHNRQIHRDHSHGRCQDRPIPCPEMLRRERLHFIVLRRDQVPQLIREAWKRGAHRPR